MYSFVIIGCPALTKTGTYRQTSLLRHPNLNLMKIKSRFSGFVTFGRTDDRGACARCIPVTYLCHHAKKGLCWLCIQSPQQACSWGCKPWSPFPTFLNSINVKLSLIWYSIIKWSARNNKNVPLFLANFWIHRGNLSALSASHLLTLILDSNCTPTTGTVTNCVSYPATAATR